MTAFAEKLKQAGADTLGAQLTTACIEGLRLHPNNASAAWNHAFHILGRQLLVSLMADMTPNPSPSEKLIRESQSLPTPKSTLSSMINRITPQNRHEEAMAPARPYAPKVLPPERLEKRRELRQIVRSKYMNSGGIAWSDVGWHELKGLLRDGKEAQALLAAGPAHVPNDGRTVGAVLGVAKVDEIVGNVRKAA